MSFINGVRRVLYIGKDGDFFAVGCLTSNSFSESIDLIDSTESGVLNGWTSSRPTNQGYNISFDGLIDTSLVWNVTYNDLKISKRGRTLIDWRIIDDGVSYYEYGSGYLNTLGDSASVDEFISFNGAIEGFGAIEKDELNVLLLETNRFFLQENNTFLELQ